MKQIKLDEIMSRELKWLDESVKPSADEVVLCDDGTGLFWAAEWTGTRWMTAGHNSRTPSRWARY